MANGKWQKRRSFGAAFFDEGELVFHALVDAVEFGRRGEGFVGDERTCPDGERVGFEIGGEDEGEVDETHNIVLANEAKHAGALDGGLDGGTNDGITEFGVLL